VISTHVLDTQRGKPAEGVRVELYRGDALLAAEETDSDGRIADLGAVSEAGSYRLAFVPGSSPFFSRIEVEIALDGTGNVHVPLLLSPYGCTIYRGS
jgi:5-hydroxyisourate hydrolase